MTRPRILASGTTLVLLPATAWAHVGRAPEPHDFWQTWTLAPAVLIAVAGSAAWYARGLRLLWTRGGRGRVVPVWRAWCFFASLAAIFIALVSPLDQMGSALFSAHMTQHLMLVSVAAPLLVLGDPASAMLWALPLRWRRRVGLAWRNASTWRAIWRASKRPAAAWVLHVGTLWLWHLPVLYDAALRHEGLHVLEHSTFFVTAYLFWYAVVPPHGRRAPAGVRLFYLFSAALQSTILGAAITLARRPWYSPHFGTTTPWGLNPLEDQQLAGLLMWVPAGVVYLAPLAALMWALLGDAKGRTRPHGSPRVTTPLDQRVAAGVSARGTP